MGFSECSARVDELSPDSNAGLHCALLCRVALGHVRYNDDLLPDVVTVVSECVGGPFHSVLGDREGRCPDAFREFVIYDKDQVYPEMLLWYRRVYEQMLLRCLCFAASMRAFPLIQLSH